MKKYIKFIVIFLTIIFMLPVIAYAKNKDITCSDLAIDGYMFDPTLSEGGLPFSDVAGQAVNPDDGGFTVAYEFLTRGVDIKKVKKKGMENDYIAALQQIVDIMKEIEQGQALRQRTEIVEGMLKTLEGKGYTVSDEKDKINNILTELGASEEEKKEVKEDLEDVEKLEEAQESTDMQERVEVVEETKDEPESPIYHKLGTNSTTANGLDDAIGDAEEFLKKGNQVISESDLQNFSNMMYNILLTVGIIVAVIMGGMLGLKFMTETGPEGKAEVKKLLIPYVVGCVIVFGGFAIWKIVVTILSEI